MSSPTGLLYHQQAHSSGFVAPENPNLRGPHSINGGVYSILSSNIESAPNLPLLVVKQLSGVPAPSPPLPLPGPPPLSQKHCPPSALEGSDVDGALRLPPPSSHSVISASAPTPDTAISSLDNLDTFMHALDQELHRSPNASIICSVKRNDEPENAHDGPLEQRLEKKMNVQLSIIAPAANQRIKLPVPTATFASGGSEPKPLFLSLVIAGETTRRIFGGVGLYHQNQPKSGLVNIIEGSNFSPVVCITSGRTVCIGFKFTTYPRQCDPSEDAFRVMVTIHDYDGRLVAYSLSTSAYSVKSHPRSIKRSLQASLDDSEDTGNSRPKRRRANSALATTSTSSTASNHAPPSNSSAAGGSNQQQFSGSANIGGPPIVEPAVDRSGGTPILLVDPRVQSLLQEPRGLLSLNPVEAPQPMPTLDEAVPASCSWRGGIAISLFVNNLPQEGPIYARFGHIVVKTDRKTPHVLGCKVPAAPGPCEVDVTLSKGSGPGDEMYGRSLCKFTYEEDDITRMIRGLKAEAQGPLWNAVQEYASRNRLVPSPSYAYQPTYDQSIMGPWPVASYARLEVVEEEIGIEDDVVQPETSNNVPDSEVASHSPSVIEDKRSDATETETGESTEGARGQDTKTLDMVPLDDMEDYPLLRTIPKPSASPILKPTEPISLNSPPSVMQYNLPTRSNPVDQELSGNAMANQPPLEIARPAHPPPPDQQIHTSRTGVWNPSITAQIRPTSANVAYGPPPTNAITSTPSSSVEDSAHEPSLFSMPYPPREVRQSIDLSLFYNDAVHPSCRNIRLKCHLKDPKGYQQDSKIIVRREKRVILEMQLQADCERMGWKGIALPKTGSVKPPNQQTPTGLLYFSIEVHGSTTGMTLTQPCDNCWRREMQFPGNPHGLPCYLIDFKSDSPFILFPRIDTLPYTKAEVTFHFTCYSNHQKEDYKLVARLHDEEGNLVAYHQLPYSFNCTPFRHTVGGLQDKCTSTVHTPVLSPATTTVTFESGSSSASYCTSSSRSTTSSFSQLPTSGDQDRTSIRYPAPPVLHPSRCEAIECHPTSSGVGLRKDIQQPESVDQPLLQRVYPVEGPTHGGPKIVLIGTNLPPMPTTLYARFGSAATVTSWVNPFTLECTLPPSHTGIVTVTLSHSLDHEAPMLGQSLCTFTYREEREPFLLMLRSIYSQGHELSRVPLDTLILQHASPETDLNHALRRLGQSRESLPPIDDRELEELGARFLATISDSPQWSNDLSFADQNQRTIAHLCVFFGYTRLLRKIVDWGIDLDVQDVSGLTALHCAYLREDRECVRILKEAGANEYIKDNLGRIPRRVCQYIETEGAIHSEREEPSTPARLTEEDWVHVPRWTSPSPENFTPLGTQLRPQQPWRGPSFFKAVDGGIRASSIPIPRPSIEGSSIADYESWSTAFSNLQITDSLARAPLSVTSSSSTRGGGAPQVSQYGWSHLTSHTSPPRLQRNVSHAASAKYGSLPPTSSFNSLKVFPMPQPAVESEGMVHSERVAGPFSSVGELNAPKMFTSSENSPLLGAHMMLQLGWRNSSDIATSDGIRASPMPMPEPSSEESYEDPCIQELSYLHISESPQPLTMSFSSITGSPSGRGDGPPRYGWSHRICPQSPTGVQRNLPSGAPVIFHSLQVTSSFDSPAPAFPMPEPALPFPVPEPVISFPVPEPTSHLRHLEPVPLSLLSPRPAVPSFTVSGQAVPSLQLHHFDLAEASFTIPEPTLPSFAVPGLTLPIHEPPVPSYPVPEPTGYLEQTNEYMNSLRLSPAPQHSPPRMAPYPVSTHHIPAQTPHFHSPHATHTNSLHVFTSPPSSQSTQQMHQPPSSPRFDPPPSPPPPPQYGSSEGVAPNSPPRNSGFAKEEAAAIRHQFQETMRTTWLSAGREKEKLESRIGQTSVTLGSGSDTLTDAGEESIKEPKQGEI